MKIGWKKFSNGASRTVTTNFGSRSIKPANLEFGWIFKQSPVANAQTDIQNARLALCHCLNTWPVHFEVCDCICSFPASNFNRLKQGKATYGLQNHWIQPTDPDPDCGVGTLVAGSVVNAKPQAGGGGKQQWQGPSADLEPTTAGKRCWSPSKSSWICGKCMR